MAGRGKRQLGDFFGLTNFGVNRTRVAPEAGSALRHFHSKQDEFIYILAGSPVLIADEGETTLVPGMCAGFRTGTENAHQLVNRTNEDVLYPELGDRTKGDAVTCPDDDLKAVLDANENRQFLHKNGRLY